MVVHSTGSTSKDTMPLYAYILMGISGLVVIALVIASIVIYKGKRRDQRNVSRLHIDSSIGPIGLLIYFTIYTQSRM